MCRRELVKALYLKAPKKMFSVGRQRFVEQFRALRVGRKSSFLDVHRATFDEASLTVRRISQLMSVAMNAKRPRVRTCGLYCRLRALHNMHYDRNTRSNSTQLATNQTGMDIINRTRGCPRRESQRTIKQNNVSNLSFRHVETDEEDNGKSTAQTRVKLVAGIHHREAECHHQERSR